MKKIFKGTGNFFSRISKVKNIRSKAEQVLKSRGLPKSKRHSALLGMATVFSIFGITMLGSSLPAIAKDIKDIPGKPNTNPSSPPSPSPSPKPSQELTKAVTGAAASVCALAVSSGSFLVGAACGIIVVYGILKAEGK
jgi:hypothetical protein